MTDRSGREIGTLHGPAGRRQTTSDRCGACRIDDGRAIFQVLDYKHNNSAIGLQHRSKSIDGATDRTGTVILQDQQTTIERLDRADPL
jgi:hypothetical protein